MDAVASTHHSDTGAPTDHTSDIDTLLQAELQRINAGGQRASSTEDCLALAFSGGGIRSASFGMGLMQALVMQDKLRLMDYLSSVSGGGYLSSALTWYLSCRNRQDEALFDCGERFPFGKKNTGNKHDRNSAVTNILNYLRLHGNYLIPGKGLGVLAFIGTILRVMVGSFLVYFLLLTLIFIGLHWFIDGVNDLLHLRLSFFRFFVLLFLGAAAHFVLCSLLFSLRTYPGVAGYKGDVRTQVRLGSVLQFGLVMLLLGLLPVIELNLGLLWTYATGQKTDSPLLLEGGIALSSSFLGTIFSFLAHRRAIASDKGITPLQINVAAFFLLFGMLLGAYCVAGFVLDQSGIARLLLLLLPLVSLLFAIRCDLNLFGLNRMYRNRLMETFMQAPDRINEDLWAPATAANTALVADMCQYPNHRPYHLINCNIVLPDSDRASFRGRKGDSFVVSPLYTGSDATGWRSTRNYSRNRRDAGLTLPTAMAISGAAANPNAGVSGRGPSTEKTVSLVMSLLNLRLGFWAENPRYATLQLPPNYFFPGLQAVSMFGKGLTEEKRYIELSDGGHFENLALYELLRRRVKLIIISDAGQDGAFEYSDLANAVEKARVDFGIKVDFDEGWSLHDLMPGSAAGQQAGDRETARRGFALARLYYPEQQRADGSLQRAATTGWLVYVKPTLIPSLGIDVVGYRRQHAEFPHQTTLDQFFDEVQFEAYRELGYQIGKDLLQTLADAKPEDREILKRISVLMQSRQESELFP